MKPLFVLARIVFVGCLWSVVFIEGIRVFMLQNWHFDIFWPAHWAYVWNLWSLGWVIDTPKEWAFVLILAGFIPLWLTGWIALALVPWEKWVEKVLKYPLSLYRSVATPIKVATKTPVVVKKKSYKEIRPKGMRAPIYDYNETSATASKPALQSAPATLTATAPALEPSNPYATPSTLKEKAVNARETFSHSLFDLDDGDDDFDLDFDSIGKSETSVSKTPEKPTSFDFFDDEPEPQKAKNKPKEVFDFEFDDDEDNDDVFEERRVPQKNNRENGRRQENRSENRADNRGDNRREFRNNNRSDDNGRMNERSRNNRDQNFPRATNNQPSQRVSQPQTRPSHPVADVLVQKGYEILAGQTIRNTIVDFIGIAEDKILLCLVDKEAGDWLADEERFNNEEPLWFSESSHRISPVRKIDLVKKTLLEKLEENGLHYDIVPFVVIQMANIINAEDMFEIWHELGVEVTRINRGSPKEIKLFSKTVEDAEARVEKSALDALRKLIRNMA